MRFALLASVGMISNPSQRRCSLLKTHQPCDTVAFKIHRRYFRR
jgi:hypothetical protein